LQTTGTAIITLIDLVQCSATHQKLTSNKLCNRKRGAEGYTQLAAVEIKLKAAESTDNNI